MSTKHTLNTAYHTLNFAYHTPVGTNDVVQLSLILHTFTTHLYPISSRDVCIWPPSLKLNPF